MSKQWPVLRNYFSLPEHSICFSEKNGTRLPTTMKNVPDLSQIPDGSVLEESRTQNSNDVADNTINVDPDDLLVDHTRKPRKVVPQPSRWKQNIRKERRNLGQEYETRKNKIVPSRSMKEPCGAKCRLQCTTKISEPEREKIFSNFWQIGDIDKQRYFLAKCMKTIAPLYRYAKNDSKRSNNQAFFLQTASKPGGIRVCKTFFIATLGVTIRMIRTTLEKKTDVGIVNPDLRGKNRLGSGIRPEVKEGVVAHINSIPRIESHYLRAQTSREFIDGSKTLTDLHKDYVTQCEASNKSFVSLSMYRHIFNTQFNISFFVPKKDQCEECVAHYKKSKTEQEQDVGFKQHLLEKQLSREEKNNDKGNSSADVIVAAFDLQAILTVPRGDISVFYYISKLSTYNFTICEIQNMKAYCFVWHEGEANRGANEIASCLLSFLKEKSRERENNFEVIFYSDNCCGQNKNKYVIGLYTYALETIPNLLSITHKFLIKGHTQNEGDSVHSTIEKQIKLSLKAGPIYTPAHYAQIIRDSKKKAPFYNVLELCHKDFLDFKNFTSHIGNNFNTNDEGEVISFSDIKVLKVYKHKLGSFDYKLSYAEKSFKTITLRRRKSRNDLDPTIDDLVLKPAYKKPCGISDKKKQDLMKLFKKSHIPNAYYPFYQNL